MLFATEITSLLLTADERRYLCLSAVKIFVVFEIVINKSFRCSRLPWAYYLQLRYAKNSKQEKQNMLITNNLTINCIQTLVDKY